MRTRLSLITLLLFLGLVACGQPDSRSTSGSSLSPSAIVVSTPVLSRTPILHHYVVSHSLEEIVKRSTVIVIGKISGVGGVINSSRDLDDPTKPSSHDFGIGQIYIVQVSRYIKGSGPATLNIIQFEGSINANPASITPQDIEQAKQVDDYAPFQIGTEYLLFLRRADDLGSDPVYYGGSALPWRFELLANGGMKAQGPRGAGFGPDSGYDPNMSQLAQVEQLVRAEQSGAPTK